MIINFTEKEKNNKYIFKGPMNTTKKCTRIVSKIL